MTNRLYLLVGAIIIFAIGFGSARYSTPVKVVTKEKVVFQEKKDVVTVIKRVKDPNGTITTETTIQDKSNINSTSQYETIVKNEKPQWRASALFEFKPNTYGVSVERRIAGPIFAGAWGTTEHIYGLSLGVEF